MQQHKEKQNHTQNDDTDICYFIYNNKQYPFKFHYFKNTSKILSCNTKEIDGKKIIQLVDERKEKFLNFSDDSIENFIRYIEHETITLNNENVVTLNYLGNKYKISSLVKSTNEYIKKHCDELVFQIISIYQEGDLSIETKTYEDFLIKNLIDYIEDDRFLSLKISTIYRILYKFLGKNHSENKKIADFCFKCLTKFGREASCLFEFIDFNDIGIEYLHRILTQYSNIFDFHFINYSFLKSFLESQNEISNEKSIQISKNEIDQTKNEQEKQIKELKDEIKRIKKEGEKKQTEFEKLFQEQQKTIEFLKDEIKQMKNEQNEIKSLKSVDHVKSHKKSDEIQFLNEKSDQNKVMALMCTKNFWCFTSLEFFNQLEGEAQFFIINQMILTNNNNDMINKIGDLLSYLSEEQKKSKNENHSKLSYISIKTNSNSIKKGNEEITKQQQILFSIGINCEMTEILYENGSINSKEFISFCENFSEIILNVCHPSQLFDNIFKSIIELKKLYSYKFKISVFVQGLKETDFTFTENKYIDYVQLDKTTKIIKGINNKGPNGSFYNCSSLTQISIPSSVTEILQEAFEFCYSITEITIPFSVKEIGRKAFAGCLSLEKIMFDDNSSLEIIGEYAFSECEKINQISIPSSVTKIQKFAFNECRSLTKVFFDDGQSMLHSIEKYAFNECSSLLQISIPSSVTQIGIKAFYGCSSLFQITISSSFNLTEIGIKSNIKIINK